MPGHFKDGYLWWDCTLQWAWAQAQQPLTDQAFNVSK